MNSNFNRQFILIDFRLLENREFLKFIGSSEFATYLVLRRNIWRGSSPHYMGLHDLYLRDKLLACSLDRAKIAEVTHTDPDNISRHLTGLETRGVIQRRRTGRQNIYILGEWVDVHGDGSYKLEWFYLEGIFGISKSDLTESVRSDAATASDQTRPKSSDQTRRSASDNNIEVNRQENTVNGVVKGEEKGSLQQLKDLEQPPEQTAYVAQHILDALGDEKSRRFYKLVAAKIPEGVIRETLSQIKVDGAQDPARLFTYRMQRYALTKQKL
jgi:DNA-binding MarR family transcriptional regulator